VELHCVGSTDVSFDRAQHNPRNSNSFSCGEYRSDPPDPVNYRSKPNSIFGRCWSDGSRDLLRIAWELEDEQSGQIRKVSCRSCTSRRPRCASYDFFEGAGLNPQLTAIAPTIFILATRNVERAVLHLPRERAACRAGEDPGDPNAVVANQDSTRPVFRSKSCGSVAAVFGDFNDPQDQRSRSFSVSSSATKWCLAPADWFEFE